MPFSATTNLTKEKKSLIDSPHTPLCPGAPTTILAPGRPCLKPCGITKNPARAFNASKALHRILGMQGAETLFHLSEAPMRLRKTSLGWMMSPEQDTEVQSMRPESLIMKRARSDWTDRGLDQIPRPQAEAGTGPGIGPYMIYSQEIQGSYSCPFGSPLHADSNSPTLSPDRRLGTKSSRHTLKSHALPRIQREPYASQASLLPFRYNAGSCDSTYKALLPSTYQSGHSCSFARGRTPVCTRLSQRVMQRRSRTILSWRSTSGVTRLIPNPTPRGRTASS
jgi:hypothetical protein